MSIGDLLADHANRTPDRVLVERLVDGSWRPVTAAEMHATATAIAKGLVAAGIEPGDRVAIMSRTRAEWTFLDFGIWYAGAVPVPVYETSSAEQTAWILSDSGAVAAVVENATHAGVVEEARAEAPQLREVWQIEDGALEKLAAAGVDVDDATIRERRDAVRIGDLATVIYTSGTTGRPKGPSSRTATSSSSRATRSGRSGTTSCTRTPARCCSCRSRTSSRASSRCCASRRASHRPHARHPHPDGRHRHVPADVHPRSRACSRRSTTPRRPRPRRVAR